MRVAKTSGTAEKVMFDVANYDDNDDDANDNHDDYDDIDSNDNDDKNDDDDDDSTQAERTCNPALWESSLTHR